MGMGINEPRLDVKWLRVHGLAVLNWCTRTVFKKNSLVLYYGLPPLENHQADPILGYLYTHYYRYFFYRTATLGREKIRFRICQEGLIWIGMLPYTTTRGGWKGRRDGGSSPCYTLVG